MFLSARLSHSVKAFAVCGNEKRVGENIPHIGNSEVGVLLIC